MLPAGRGNRRNPGQMGRVNSERAAKDTLVKGTIYIGDARAQVNRRAAISADQRRRRPNLHAGKELVPAGISDGKTPTARRKPDNPQHSFGSVARPDDKFTVTMNNDGETPRVAPLAETADCL